MKKFIVLLCCIMCFTSTVELTLLTDQETVQAADKEKKKIKKFALEFETPIAIAISHPEKIGTKKIKLNSKRTYNFKSDKSRKIISMVPTHPYHNKENDWNYSISFYSKRYFGKSVKASGEIIIGEFGNGFPILKVNKIKKQKGNKYKVSYTLYTADELVNGNTKVADGVIYVKKKAKSHYGYVATKLVINRNGHKHLDF